MHNRHEFAQSLKGTAFVANDYVSLRRESLLFAVRWFDKDKRELGYWIPDVSDTAGGVTFETPREWPEGCLRSLNLHEIA